MQFDLEKKMGYVDIFEGIVRLSETYLDGDSVNHLKEYFDSVVGAEYDEDEVSKTLVNTMDVINRLILTIPKRIERLSELNAPQVIIDNEKAALDSLKKINSNIL